MTSRRRGAFLPELTAVIGVFLLSICTAAAVDPPGGYAVTFTLADGNVALWASDSGLWSWSSQIDNAAIVVSPPGVGGVGQPPNSIEVDYDNVDLSTDIFFYDATTGSWLSSIRLDSNGNPIPVTRVAPGWFSGSSSSSGETVLPIDLSAISGRLGSFIGPAALFGLVVAVGLLGVFLVWSVFLRMAKG